LSHIVTHHKEWDVTETSGLELVYPNLNTSH